MIGRIEPPLGRQGGAIGLQNAAGGAVGVVGKEFAGADHRIQVAERSQGVESAQGASRAGQGILVTQAHEDRRRGHIRRPQKRLQHPGRTQRRGIGVQADVGRRHRSGLADLPAQLGEVRRHALSADRPLDERKFGAGVDLRGADAKDAFERLGVGIDDGDARQAKKGGPAVDDQLARDRLASLAETDDQGVDPRVAKILGDQERRMGDDQRPGRDAGHGEDPGAWLVEGGGGVLGEARIAHQHGDEGVRRGGAGGARQHQGVGVVVLGQKDVVGATSIGDDGGDMVVRRPGQGDRSQRLGGDAGRAEPHHALAPADQGDAFAGPARRLERLGGDAIATDDDHLLAQQARRRLGGALPQHRADGEDRGPERGDQRRPAADQEAPVGIAGMALISVTGDIEQGHGAIGRFVDPIAVGEPAPQTPSSTHRRPPAARRRRNPLWFNAAERELNTARTPLDSPRRSLRPREAPGQTYFARRLGPRAEHVLLARTGRRG